MKLRISKLKLLVLVIMSVVGLIASSTVLITFYALKTSPPLCGITGSFFGIRFDCGAVLGSRYSTVFGVPLEFLALGYFAANLALVYLIAFGSDRISRVSMRTLFGWRFIGLILVPYLVFIEVILLKAICIYCTIMHVAIIADFIIISYLLFFRRIDTESYDSGTALAGGGMPQITQAKPRLGALTSPGELLCQVLGKHGVLS